MFDDGFQIFADDNNNTYDNNENSELTFEETWNVLIVDDEQEVHNITKLVLRDFRFEGKSLNFISAYSAAEAQDIMLKRNDIAVVLLDVVMESDDSGLNLVKYIRKDLNNSLTRIVLRTGQPGQAPEKKVIIEYDINDYKEKTELTSQKLFTTVAASVRSFRDISTIHSNKNGLERMIQSTGFMFKKQSIHKFASEVLNQLVAILGNDENEIHGFSSVGENSDFSISAGIGEYKNKINKQISKVVSVEIFKNITEVLCAKKSTYYKNSVIVYLKSNDEFEYIVYIHKTKRITEFEKYLIEIYLANASVAIDNIHLNKEVENTQKEILFTLGEVAEVRSKETSNHVKRVAEYSYILSLKYGMSKDEAELIRMASPMHDIGKLGIPDGILNKPGILTSEEFEIMKTHSIIGYEILNRSNRKLLKAASIIAQQHHEKYNGKGYPFNLKGEDIHIYGRITALADVFDALGSDRIYKKAWNIDKILEFFRNERAEHFDPKLIDIFFENVEDILKIKEKFKD